MRRVTNISALIAIFAALGIPISVHLSSVLGIFLSITVVFVSGAIAVITNLLQGVPIGTKKTPKRRT